MTEVESCAIQSLDRHNSFVKSDGGFNRRKFLPHPDTFAYEAFPERWKAFTINVSVHFCFTLEPGKSSRPLQVALVATHADQISSQKDAENLAQHVADQLQAKFGHVFDIHEQVNHSTISGDSKINE